MTIEEQLRFEKNNAYLQAKKIKKLENDLKEVRKQLKECEKSRDFWKDAYMRTKGDKR